MGLIQPLHIIAQHIVDMELVQAFTAKENDTRSVQPASEHLALHR